SPRRSRAAYRRPGSLTKNGSFRSELMPLAGSHLRSRKRLLEIPMTTRRTFLQTSAALALTAASYDRVFGANEVLNVGCIGTGGRCRHLMKSLATIPDVRIAAVCDVWDVSLAEGKKL